jgi:hypothetical protein
VKALKWMGRHKILSIVGALVLLGLIGSVGGDPDTQPAAKDSQPTKVQPTTPESSAPPEPAPTKAPTTEQVIAEAKPKTALALLGALAVKGRAPMTGYSRDAFGQAWADANRNGCDTRNDILKRDLTARTYKAGTGGCVVLTGTLADPYTATDIAFVRGGASEVDIDHVVALGNGWATGAASWPARKRVAFANDPLNLLAVDAGANRQKGDGDAATWLPSNKGYRCAYVARQVAVKAKYRLWVTPAERAAVARVLSSCTAQVAPVGTAPTLAPISGSASAPRPKPTKTAVTSGTDPNYGTCKEAKANGAGPYYRGKDPEYDYYRDSDGDGVVCE